MHIAAEFEPCLRNCKAAPPEIALIRAARRRAELLGRKPQDFTFEERQAIRQGERALQQLLEAHRRLILRLARTYQVKGYNSTDTDLEQEATVAFFDAVATYDFTKGARLITWAYLQIRARLQKVTRQLIKEAVAVAKLMRNETTYTDLKLVAEQEFSDRLNSLVHKLTEKQQKVVLLYLQDLSWTEIALKLQTTADAVRMLWNRAIQRLQLLLLGVGEKRQEGKHKITEVQSQPQSGEFSKPLLSWLFLQYLSRSLICLPKVTRRKLRTTVVNSIASYRYLAIRQFWLDSTHSSSARGSPLLLRLLDLSITVPYSFGFLLQPLRRNYAGSI